MTTICTKCQHHVHKVINKTAPEVWYNHLCGASPLPDKTDFITGEVAKGRLAHCRDINHGNCPKFEPKKARMSNESNKPSKVQPKRSGRACGPSW